jgi:hypothetical protein
LLGAYRLDDRSPEEFTALAAHLAACEACRSVEVAFRRAGALVRHLPTEVPPPSFRASVYAAIEAEQRRLQRRSAKYAFDSPAARLARAQTDPGLPIVRARPAVTRRHSPPQMLTPRAPAAVAAVAAVLLLGLVGVRALPGGGLGEIGNALGDLLGGQPNPQVSHYMPTGRYALAASALATGTWLVYSAADRSGQMMLVARDRQTGSVVDLLGTPQSGPMTVHALTDSWAIWSTGSDDAGSDWCLYASHLPASGKSALVGGHIAAPLVLACNANLANDSAPDALVRFTGVWAGSDTVLLTALTRGGTSELLRMDLPAGIAAELPSAGRVVAHASAPDRLLTSPSWDGHTYYWSEVWIGGDGHLRSAIWQGDDAGHAGPLTADATSFAPHLTSGMLVWIEGSANAVIPQGGSGDLESIARAVEAVWGALEARALSGGHPWQVASGAQVGSLQAAGPFVLWRAGAIEHAYDLRVHAACAADQQVRGAHFAAPDSAALTWGERTGAIAVLDR